MCSVFFLNWGSFDPGYKIRKMSKRLGNTRKEQVQADEVPATPASLHRCSFFPYQPAAINHIASTPSTCLPQVAVIRATEPSSLELFTPSSDWSVERVIYGHAGENFECAVFVGPAQGDHEMEIDSSEDEVDISSAVAKNSKVELDSLKYTQDTASKLNSKHFLPLSESSKFPRARLFTAGVDGRLREWSNAVAQPQAVELFSVDINGGAIWSLSVSPDQKTLAIGCEDGRIRLFSIYDRSVEFLRGFEAVEATSDGSSARILSLAWNDQGNTLISGSASGSVKLWNCETGRPIHSIKLANLSIWTVAFCDSQTFVTGDSKGQVQFWDIASGTLLQSFPAFGADVLALTCLPGKVFATGVDHKIVEFVQVTSPNAVGHVTDKWIQGGKRYFHTHDIRAITNLTIKYERDDGKFYERSVLISGGNDCTLVVSDPQAFDRALERSKSFNAHQRRILPFSRNVPMIQMAQNARVVAGRIGNTIQIWKLADSTDGHPIHLADLKISRHEAITSFAISPSGTSVCILTISEMRFFKLENGNIRKIETPSSLKMTKKATFLHLVAFLNEFTVACFNSCEMLQLLVEDSELVQGDSLQLGFSARRVSVAADSLALCTDNHVFLRTKKTVKKLYESSHQITSITQINKQIIISDCRNAIIRISETGEAIETFAELPKEWKIRKEPIMGIQAHPTVANKISCWSDASIAQLTFPAAESASNKRKLSKSSPENTSVECKLIDDYRPLLFFAHLPESADSVVIERPWISIVESFPPAFYRNRYGAQ